MGKTIDLTGQKFGYWTVMYKSDKRASDRSVMWHCVCKCGNEKDVVGTCLRNGSSKSCGCYQKEQTSKANIKIIPPGVKFGKLTVIKPIPEKRSNGETIYSCKCDCGKYVEIRRSSLVTNKTTSCGCNNNSLGVENIIKLLNENNIPYIVEYRFLDCKDKRPLPFDFYINKKYIIEFDGKQHFEYSNNGWNNKEKFELTQKHDKIKNQYCKDNNIPLIRIPYTHLKDLCIEDLLLETTKYRVV